MIMEQPEAQALVDAIAPGIAVTVATVQEPTYDVSPDGKRSPRLDAAGEHIRHPVVTVHLTLGRWTCSVDYVYGSASPHERTPRTRSEIEALIRQQVGNLIREATAKPRTAAEHAAWVAEQAREGAERAEAARVAKAAEERSAMTNEERAAADYLAKHGEPDFAAHAEHLHAYDAHLFAAVAMGAMTEEEAASRRTAIAAWKRRTELRVAATVKHVDDPEALAAAHAKINEGV